MAKKQLNVSGIINELESSAFFPSPVLADEEQRMDAPQQSPMQEDQPGMAHTVRNTRAVEPNDRTVESTQTSSLLLEMSQGVKSDRRPTERYSFEIYSDQIPQIEELQYLYKKRTGQKLPASRILREALEAYLDNAFAAMKRKK